MAWTRWFRVLLPLDGPLHRTGPTEPPPGQGPGSSALAGLLDALEEVADQHSEIFDTDVRERVWVVVDRCYVRRHGTFEVPSELGMFSVDGNVRLKTALDRHLRNLLSAAETDGLETEAERLAVIQNSEIRSSRQGFAFEDFFGAP
jgi:hypothetical protein